MIGVPTYKYINIDSLLFFLKLETFFASFFLSEKDFIFNPVRTITLI